MNTSILRRALVLKKRCLDGVALRNERMLATPADMPLITQGLLAHGFAAEEVAKIMGGNWRRFLREGIGGEKGR